MSSRLCTAIDMRLHVREIVIYALFGAMLVAAQLALSFLPNIELVSLLVIVYAHALGLKALFPVYIFVLAQGLIYGFGLWFLNYMYIWVLLVFFTLLLKRFAHESAVLPYALLSAAFGLFFGFLCAIPYLFIGGIGAALSYFVAGIPFDIVHCVGNAAAALLLFSPAVKLVREGLQKLALNE